MPKRIQLRRTKGWRMPAGTVRCVRPGILGNPWVHDDPAVAVSAFREVLDGNYRFIPGLRLAKGQKAVTRERVYEINQAIEAVRGKDCACFCALDAPCHVDVIIERANRPVSS